MRLPWWRGDSQAVTTSTFGVRDGATVAVRRLRLAGVDFSSVTQSPGDYLGTLLVVTFFFLLSGGWLLIASYDAFVERPRRRALVRYGVAAIGTIAEKEESFRRNGPTLLCYTYAGPGGRSLRNWEEVPGGYAERLEPSSQLVVVYSAKDPSAVMIYDLCGYAARGAW